jgi:hypothetical protein
MLSVSNAGMARASSLTSLSMDVQVNMLQGAVIASLDDRVKIKEVAQLIRDYHSGMLTSESSPRARSNSTILPSKEIRDLRRREEEKKTNVFDHSPYKEMASKNKKLEMLLGKSLSCSTELALIAKKIREVTGSPMRFLDFSAQQQQKIIEESSYILEGRKSY